MNNIYRALFIAVISVPLLFSGCKSSETAQKKPVNLILDDNRPVEDFVIKSGNVKSTFHDAVKAKTIGEYELAEKLFKAVLKSDPKNSAAMFELSKLFLNNEQIEEASLFITNAVKLEPENKWYQELNAEILTYFNKDEEAIAIYQSLINLNPRIPGYYFELAYLYEKKNNLKKAIETYNDLQIQIGIEEEIIFRKQKLYLRLDDLDAAANELKQLIDAYPSESIYYTRLAEMYQVNNRSDLAVETLKDMLEVNPNDPDAVFALAIFYRERKEEDKAKPLMIQSFSNPDLSIDKKIAYLIRYITRVNNEEETKEGFEFTELTIAAHPNEAKGYAMYGDLLYNSGDNKNALSQYKKSIKNNNEVFTVWQQMLFIQADLSKFDSLLVTSEMAMELFPSQALPYFLNGVAKSRLKKYDEAVMVLERALIIGESNLSMISDVYSTLGDTYHSLKNHVSSDSCYEKSLEINPNNAFVLNNYSYYLSLRKSELTHARDMARKANDLQPGNSAFQDTYGWILFELGEYESAKKWIEKALQNGGSESGTILEHYGDTIFKLGEIENAVEYWEKAKRHGNDSKELDRKILHKKLYE